MENQLQPEPKKHGGARVGAGRKKGTTVVPPEKKKIQDNVCLVADDWAYIDTFHPSDRHRAIHELITRCKKLWPGGAFPVDAGTSVTHEINTGTIKRTRSVRRKKALQDAAV